jgi:phosphatidylglycerophosphatase A
LDIIKPFPIRTIENKLSGGAGIVMDDVAAGIIGNCLLRAVFYVKDF